MLILHLHSGWKGLMRKVYGHRVTFSFLFQGTIIWTHMAIFDQRMSTHPVSNLTNFLLLAHWEVYSAGYARLYQLLTSGNNIVRVYCLCFCLEERRQGPAVTQELSFRSRSSRLEPQVNH